jgi:predicted amidophosphoribosyltransferase
MNQGSYGDISADSTYIPAAVGRVQLGCCNCKAHVTNLPEPVGTCPRCFQPLVDMPREAC